MVELKDFKISPLGATRGPGVYAIWARNMSWETGEAHLLYIGSGENMYKRINSMQHPYRIAFNRLNGSVYTSSLNTEDYINIEASLIKKYRPILNIQGKK